MPIHREVHLSPALQSTEAQRLRQVEFERRIFPILLAIAGVMWAGLALLALSHPPEDVMVTAVLGVAYFAFLLVSQRRAMRSATPLVWLALQELGVIVLLASCMTWSGGVHSAALPITVVVALIIGVRFPTRWVAAQVPLYVLIIVAGIWIGDADEIVARPVEGLSWLSAFVLAAAVTNMLARAERNARRDAVHDALTGLLNRKALDVRVQDAKPHPNRRAETLSVIAADLDGLKAVNDSFGHEAGDDVLREVAAALAASIREGDLLYRLGGDEFLVLLPATPTSEAAALAERLRTRVADRRPAGRDVSLSAGVAGVVHERVDLEHLISRADRALYAAKQGGRDRVHIADPDGAYTPTSA